MTDERCHCGQPLHYTNPEIRTVVDRLIAAAGSRFVPIISDGRAWYVDRHYIALHGIATADLPALGFRELFVCPSCRRVSFNPTDLRERYCGACHTWVQ